MVEVEYGDILDFLVTYGDNDIWKINMVFMWCLMAQVIG